MPFFARPRPTHAKAGVAHLSPRLKRTERAVMAGTTDYPHLSSLFSAKHSHTLPQHPPSSSRLGPVTWTSTSDSDKFHASPDPGPGMVPIMRRTLLCSFNPLFLSLFVSFFRCQSVQLHHWRHPSELSSLEADSSQTLDHRFPPTRPSPIGSMNDPPFVDLFVDLSKISPTH